MGYMLGITLVFKASILSSWFDSKLRIIAFLKGPYTLSRSLLLLRRWFLDNVLNTWIQEHIIDNLVEGFEEVAQKS